MKIGDKIRVTFECYGEAVLDRRGNMVFQKPHSSTNEGTVNYIGPECPFPSVEVVRCTNGLQFYPTKNGPMQIVEVLNEL
jgi:hypothetical protein